MLEIQEVQGRFEKGMTEPFLCKCCDGKLYVVKTDKTLTKKELIAEYVCARLAQEIGLPVPNCEIVYIPYEIELLLHEDWQTCMQEGYAFASEYIEDAATATFERAKNHCPIDIKKEIFVFDRLIRNSHRCYGETGEGNINLLYSWRNSQIFIIDHNLAFPYAAEVHEFECHVYNPSKLEAGFDLADEMIIPGKMAAAVAKLDDIIAELPQEWHPEYDADAFFDSIRASLARINQPDFWRSLS